MSSISYLSRTAKSPTAPVALRPILPFLYPTLQHEDPGFCYGNQRKQRRRTTRPRQLVGHGVQAAENAFIAALARAGSCQAHSWASPGQKHPRQHALSQPNNAFRGTFPAASAPSRGYHSGRSRQSAAAAVQADVTRDQLTGLVDLYPMHDVPDAGEEGDIFAEDRTSKSKSRLKLDDQDRSWEEDKTPEWPDIIVPKGSWSQGEVYTADDVFAHEEKEIVDELEALLNADGVDHAAIFEVYQQLPFPRVSYLPDPLIRSLLEKMAITKRNNERHVVRYLSILDDMKVANVPANVAEWSTAIKMAGQAFKVVTDANMESAMYIWRDMECRAGVQSTDVTFTILFELAAKAGKAPLVELILQEMEIRGLPKTRFFRLLTIFYHGVVGDGDAVRKAYREFVAAGEIVDTSVLNAVIVSLYRCGETAAAESIFERMKHMQLSPSGRSDPPRDWARRRQYFRWLDAQAARLKHDEEARRQLQNSAPLGPDSRTYRIMLGWAATETGDWPRVRLLRDQMRASDIEMSWLHYRSLFEGFSRHGPGPRRRITDWTEGRLQRVWEEYLEALAGDPLEFAFSQQTVQIVLHAWWMTCGPEKMAIQWEVLRNVWKDPSAEDLRAISAWVHHRFPQEGWEPGSNLHRAMSDP